MPLGLAVGFDGRGSGRAAPCPKCRDPAHKLKPGIMQPVPTSYSHTQHHPPRARLPTRIPAL